MGLIKKRYQQIISYGLIAIGLICLLCLIIISYPDLYFYWLSSLLIIVGLTLSLFIEKEHQK